jgi:hypothetical protein
MAAWAAWVRAEYFIDETGEQLVRLILEADRRYQQARRCERRLATQRHARPRRKGCAMRITSRAQAVAMIDAAIEQQWNRFLTALAQKVVAGEIDMDVAIEAQEFCLAQIPEWRRSCLAELDAFGAPQSPRG